MDAPPVEAGRPGRLTRRLLVMLVPPLAILSVAALLSLVLALRAQPSTQHDGEPAAAAQQQREVRASLDELFGGTLALVAGGVGQQVTTADEVQALVGEVRAAESASVPGAAGADQATAARQAFAEAVGDALAASGGDPLELGNELSALAELHGAAVESNDVLVASLDAMASEGGPPVQRSSLLPILVLVLGVGLAVLAFLFVGRRLREGVDLPVDRTRDTIRRWRAGESPSREHVGGLPELAALGDELVEATTEAHRHLESLARRAEWGEQSRMIFEALDLADDEASLFDVVTRALGVIDPTRPVEMLLADRGPSRLTVVATNPNMEAPGSPVDGAAACVALRRGQVSVFDSSSSINSCPMIRQRPGGSVSGVCVPLTVSARPAGVIHMIGPDHHPPDAHIVDRLVSLASQVGNRLGSLRTLESTRQEASTDGLTRLPNRRSLEADVSRLLELGTPFVMVLADLDKFKRLNDNYGHEVGDKALQLFAGVLRDNVRGNDVVARLGGEEFVLVYPKMSVEISIEAIGRLRAALARAVASSAVPAFTCSFGIAHSSVGADGDAILRIADAGLLRAKELGGDQAVFADAELAAAVFAEGGAGNRGHRDGGEADPRR